MNKARKNDLLMLLSGIIIFLILQGLMSAKMIGAFWQLNIIVICINIVLAASLNLINGITGQFSLGHAGFMAIGAYVAAIITLKQDGSFVVGLVGAFIAAASLGFFIGVPTLRLKGDYLAIATLGLSEIIRVCILNVDYVGGASGFMGIPKFTTFAWAFGLMLFTLFVIKNIVNSDVGRACIAIRENEIAAETMGINTTKYKVLSFMIGAGFAGLAGGLFSHYFQMAHPASFTFIQSITILIMIVLGGLGSISGSIIGAIVVTLLSALLADYAEWRMVIFSIALIVMMLFRPQGILGNKELSKYVIERFKGGVKRDVA